jgi:hypothetical protein
MWPLTWKRLSGSSIWVITAHTYIILWVAIWSFQNLKTYWWAKDWMYIVINKFWVIVGMDEMAKFILEMSKCRIVSVSSWYLSKWTAFLGSTYNNVARFKGVFDMHCIRLGILHANSFVIVILILLIKEIDFEANRHWYPVPMVDTH